MCPRRSMAMAFTVRSRRASDVENCTSSGRRWALYVPSRRNVVTSTRVSPVRTVTVPCFSPVGMAAWPNSAMTCSGLASVVTSQSDGAARRSVSRTQPPTAQP